MNPDQIIQLAQRNAKQIKKRQSQNPKLSEQEQLAQFNQRDAQGLQGFQDVHSAHGTSGLTDYLHAMKKLKRKHG